MNNLEAYVKAKVSIKDYHGDALKNLIANYLHFSDHTPHPLHMHCQLHETENIPATRAFDDLALCEDCFDAYIGGYVKALKIAEDIIEIVVEEIT